MNRPRSTPPAKLAIRKRKPRSSAVVTAANQRAKSLPKLHSLQSLPPHLSPPPAVLPANLPSLTPNSSQETHLSTRAVRLSESKRKGLRHFAIRVCRKVEEKGTTTYNEVADELVAEERHIRQRKLSLADQLEQKPLNVDEKNIRRRVYDSLNVLMAMRIIAKEKKLISWQGLAMAQSPHGNDHITTLKEKIEQKKRALAEKTSNLTEITEQHDRTASIVDRNRLEVQTNGGLHDDLLMPRSIVPLHYQNPECLGIPFIIVSAPTDTNIELEMDESRQDICFTFDSAFAIFDDREILKRMDIPFPYQLPMPSAVDDVERLRVTESPL